MRTFFTNLLFFAILLISVKVSGQGEALEFKVVPPDYTSTPGTGTFLGPLSTSQRTYQLLIHESLLTDLVNKDLHAISWRIPISATTNWPAAEVLYTNFDIYLSESVPPADRSFTFANNVVGPQTQVRSGSLTVPVDAYTFGNNPNNFGPEILFDTPWLYTGGHLLIEIRHTGFSGTSRSLDAITTSTPGYLTLFSACWTGNYAGTDGVQGNFCVVRLTADDPVPVELTSFTASVSGKAVNLNWSTASETNNQGFEIQRGSSVSDFEAIGFINGAGTTTERQNYGFSDEVVNGTYFYRLKQIDFDGTFEYSNSIEVDVNIPAVFALEQNYPNPFNPSTTINFSLAEDGMINLAIYNLLGEKVLSVLNEFREAGVHSVNIDASTLSSGAYFYKIETTNFSKTMKMILAK